MNPLLLVFLFLFLGKDGISQIKDLIARIDFKSFAPVMKLLGVSDKAIEFLSSDGFSAALEQGGDIKTLLSAALAASSGINKNSPPADTADEEIVSNNYLNPIKNVASDEVEQTLGNFFADNEK